MSVLGDIYTGGPIEWISTAGVTFALIFLAEIADKSQLVCMTLAAHYRALPVLVGATFAFAFLNLLAVLFGAALANWLPENMINISVAALFASFGIHVLLAKKKDRDQEISEKSDHGIMVTTFLLISMAELGDKTQIAVAGLGGAAGPVPVWLGATLALSFTSTLGVLAGNKLLQHIPMVLLYRMSGALFLILAAFALSRIFF
jgi:putative Ca2+/H+ antiporter (TMEM165/GDT1 family)